ncbi:MAG: DUF4340 domain-containing protein [Oscillospiraceae bacterium]|nr:DUF4340 domain-containing protein [Oscillospiraceae bacterium]
MNKKNLPLLILAGVLALLVAAYFVITAAVKSGEEKKAQAQAAAAAVSSLGDVTGIAAVDAAGAGLSFDKTADGWVCAQYADWPIAQDAAATYADAYGNLSASRILTDHGDPADYGLDAPQYVFTATDGSATETLSLSKSSNGRRYAMLGGDDRIFVVDDSLADYAARGILSWVAYETLPYYTADDVTAVELDRGGTVCDYTRYEVEGDAQTGADASGDTSDTAAAAPAYAWRAAKDGADFDIVDTNVDTALYDLTQLAQSACVAYDPDKAALAAYGFDGSETTLRVTYLSDGAEKTVTLRFGATVTVGSTLYQYLMVNEDAAVTTVQADTAAELFSLLISGAADGASAQNAG